MNILGLLFDGIHYLIGLIIVCFIICIIIKIHDYYSMNNITIPISRTATATPLIKNKV
jgi:hypothetical protein